MTLTPAQMISPKAQDGAAITLDDVAVDDEHSLFDDPGQ